MLFNANSAICQLYHGENKLIFNEMMMRSALYLINTHCWICIVLAHWNNNTRIDMSSHSDTLSCFHANQSLLSLLNTECLAEKQQMLILYSLWFEPIGARTHDLPHEASMLTITPPMLFINCNYSINMHSILSAWYYFFFSFLSLNL